MRAGGGSATGRIEGSEDHLSYLGRRSTPYSPAVVVQASPTQDVHIDSLRRLLVPNDAPVSLTESETCNCHFLLRIATRNLTVNVP